MAITRTFKHGGAEVVISFNKFTKNLSWFTHIKGVKYGTTMPLISDEDITAESLEEQFDVLQQNAEESIDKINEKTI